MNVNEIERRSHEHQYSAVKRGDAPTIETYEALQFAYDFFKFTLFDGALNSCLITLQRRSKWSLGYYCPRRFVEVNGEAYTDEIALNPRHFRNRSLEEVLSTLVHEQVHLWQFHYGRPSRGRYHNKQWGAKMKEIGLYPSNTGAVGGKETGQQMTHYIIKDGAFDRACKRLLSVEFTLKWGDVVDKASTQDFVDGGDEEDEENNSNRIKYSCPVCRAAAWGKPALNIICGDCMMRMVSGFDANVLCKTKAGAKALLSGAEGHASRLPYLMLNDVTDSTDLRTHESE